MVYGFELAVCAAVQQHLLKAVSIYGNEAALPPDAAGNIGGVHGLVKAGPHFIDALAQAGYGQGGGVAAYLEQAVDIFQDGQQVL